VLIVGTDADDHGSATSSTNQEGWLFLQRALESVAQNVRNPNKVVICVGCNSGVAANAFASAFDKSSLPAAGWTRRTVVAAAELSTLFATTATPGAAQLVGAGVLYMPSDRVNTQGGLTEAQLDVLAAQASGIANFVSGGGAVVSLTQAGVPNGFTWLKSLISGLRVETTGIQGDAAVVGLPAFASAFPALSATSLGQSSHAHNFFAGSVGGLAVLATAPRLAGNSAGDEPKNDATNAVILGGADVNFAGDLHGVPTNHPLALALLMAAVGLLVRRRFAPRG
jgi:hypothetical protein